MNYALPTYFLLFLPLTVLAYQLAPQRHRWKVLLLTSWFFFWSISGKLLLYLIVSSGSIHHFGLWMDCVMEERKAAVRGLPRPERKAVKAQYQARLFSIVVLGAGVQLGVLLVLKYLPFALRSFNALTRLLHFPLHLRVPAFALPIGLSFYTMQAMSYLLDVYRGSIRADRSLARLHIRREVSFWHTVKLLRTYLLINIGELFFRAHGLSAGLAMLRRMLTSFTLRSFRDGSFYALGLDGCDYAVCAVAIAVVFGVSLLHERGVHLRSELALWHTAPRWAVYWAALLLIIIFGAYGVNYTPVDPIYASF